MTDRPRGSFGPILDAFRAVDGAALTAAEVADHAPSLTAADARAALRQLEVDGVAMSKTLDTGRRLWWLRTYSGGDDLEDAREAQALHHRTKQAGRRRRRGARGD